MHFLMLFAFIAGIATVLSPCILPILPPLLSAGAGKGRLRPLGIILGLVVSFIFFTLAFRWLILMTGVSPDALRYVAIGIIALFGLVMLFPRLSERFAEWMAPIAGVGQKLHGNTASGNEGFLSGLLLGWSLGLLWTPCAGPILATIIALAATAQVNWNAVLLVVIYTLGAAIPMFLIIYGGNRVLTTSRYLAKHAEGIRQGLGALMIGSALLLFFNGDTYFAQIALKYFPTATLDNNPRVIEELGKLKTEQSYKEGLSSINAKSASELPDLGQAPDIIGIKNWINSSPLKLKDLQGKVVLVDFWTYSCINCIRTFPYLTSWFDKYKDKGFVIVGVHAPEFEFEKDPKNVIDASKRFGIHYPIAQDNDFATWRNYRNSFWPAHYLIDQKGRIREVHFGEGGYVETENAIRLLLNEPELKMSENVAPQRYLTPETYLGSKRAERYTKGIDLQVSKSSEYHFKGPLADDSVGISGQWFVSPESIRAEGNNSIIELNFMAEDVYLVLSGSSEIPVTVLLDGKPLPKEAYTQDMNASGEIFIKEARKYDIVHLKNSYGRHTLTLKIPKGISAYAFTFG